MLERNIKAAVNRYLKKIPDLYYFSYNPYMGGVAGVSDIICCWRGLFIGIEVKRKGNTQTLKQRAFANSVKKAGGWYVLAYSVDDVKEFFKKWDNIDKNVIDYYNKQGE